MKNFYVLAFSIIAVIFLMFGLFHNQYTKTLMAFQNTIYNGNFLRESSLPIKAVRAEPSYTTWESEDEYFSLQLSILNHFCADPPLFHSNVASAKKDLSWENKNWLAIGDSITYANKYQPLVQRGLHIKAVETDAIPGRPIKPMADSITAESLKNIDLITIFGGTNDYGSNKPLGTIKDSKTRDTFYGNLKNVIGKIKTNKPENAKIAFFTPLKRGAFKNQPVYPDANLNGHKLEDYVKAEKKVCKLYSVPVIDLFSKSGLEVNNLSKYTIDNLHPNDEGYKMISKVIMKELTKLAARK